MTEFRDIKSDYEDFWLRSKESWQGYLKNAQVALQAYSGRTWTPREVENLRLEERIPQEFNIIRPHVQLFSGYARDNINSTIVAPVEGADQVTADQLSEVMKFVYEKGDTNAIMLNAFDDCLKTGIALVGLFLDFSQDPIHGDIKYFKRSFNSFIIDPDWEKPDLSDASEILLRDFMTREDAKALLPFIDPRVIDDVPAFTMDNKFGFMRNNQKFFKNKDLLSYDQYYRKVTRKVKQIVDLDTGAAVPFSDQNEEDKDLIIEKIQFAQELGINAALVERDRQFVELNILLSGEVVHSGPDPLGLEDYPFDPVLCHWEPQLSDFSLKLQGLALGLVDTQRAFNKRMIRKEDVMDSVANTGFMYKVGEVDVEDIRQTGAGKMIPVNSSQPFDDVLRQLQQGGIPPGWQEETVFLQDLANKILGVNDSLFGQDEGGNTQVSGRLAEVRATNGLRANRSIFDNFERAQKYIGSKTLRAIQNNYGPGKIRRIIGKEPTDQFFNKEFDKFDAVIKQAVLSQTQRDSFYFELLRLVEIYGPEKIPVSLAIDNLPMAGASEVQEAIAQKEQQEQLLQQQAEEDRQRAARLQDSVTEQNIALAQERRARVIADIGLAQERQSEMRQNIASANLDQAKTLAEIDKLRDENLMQLLQFLEFLRNKELAEQDVELTQNFAVADQIRQRSEPNTPEPSGQASNVQNQPNLGGQNGSV